MHVNTLDHIQHAKHMLEPATWKGLPSSLTLHRQSFFFIIPKVLRHHATSEFYNLPQNHEEH